MDSEWEEIESDDNASETGYDSDRLSDTSDWDSVPVSETRPNPPIQLEITRRLWKNLRDNNANLLQKVHKVLYTMDAEGINMPILLSLFCWGTPATISDEKIRFERTALMVSDELPRILEAMRKPPRSSESHSHYVRPAGATKALEEFGAQAMGDVIDRELEQALHLFRAPAGGVSDKELRGFSFREKARLLARPSGAPTLVRLLRNAMVRRAKPSKRKSQSRETRENLDAVCTLHTHSAASSSQ